MALTHDRYHYPDCWCYNGNSGSGEFQYFGTIIITALLIVETMIVLSAIITAFGADAEGIMERIVVFLFIIVISVIGGIASAPKKQKYAN